MSFWTWVRGESSNAATPNANGDPAITPGDPDMVDTTALQDLETRALPWIQPSSWSGYPEGWSASWQQNSHTTKLIDVAWACIDLNSSVLASMPVYRMRNGRIIEPTTWMANPDPTIYASWQEFAKQLFWDYHLGEAFVLPFGTGSDGRPARFRVIPPFLVNVDYKEGRRLYRLGPRDVTDEILHIRYQSNTISARGQGPLDVAAPRQVIIGLLERYVRNLAETGGVPLYWLEVERKITPAEGRDLMEQWIESRAKYAGHPALVGAGAKLNQGKTMSAADMSLMELTQFSEARIAILLGVPPFLVGLPGATGSLTYSNIEQLFSFHDRSSLRPKANAVMAALDSWALPGPQTLELNRDDYTRPSLLERAQAYEILNKIGALEVPEIRSMERLDGESAAMRISGGQG